MAGGVAYVVQEAALQRQAVLAAACRAKVARVAYRTSGVAQCYLRRDYSWELRLNTGTRVTGIREVDAAWLEGERDGRRGRFPRHRITPIDALPRAAEVGEAVAQLELG